MKRFPRHALLLFVLPLFLAACSSLGRQDFQPLVIDEAHILSQQTIDWLTAHSYPKGLAFIVRTVEALPNQVEVGSKADEYFDNDLEMCGNPDACKKRGVYILISQSPALIQVRVGTEIVTQARWEGITAGKIYIQKQTTISSGNVETGLKEMVDYLSTSLPQVVEIPWYKRLILNDITQELWLELDDLSLPSEGFYGNYVLKPFVQARVLEAQVVGTWWITYVVAGIVIWACKSVLQSVVGFVIGRFSRPIANSVNLALLILLEVGVAVPAAASVVLLSGSRLEDQIALRAWGISGIYGFSFSAELFNVETGILLALLIFALRLSKGLAEGIDVITLSFLPDEKQRHIFEELAKNNPLQAWILEGVATKDDMNTTDTFSQAPFSTVAFALGFENLKRGLRWGILAWLFLPRALSLVMIFVWVPTLGNGLLKLAIGAFKGPAKSFFHSLLEGEQDPQILQQVSGKVRQLLTTGEEIKYFVGQRKTLNAIENLSPDCVIFTNKRFIVYKPKLLGNMDFEDCVWHDLRDARLKEGIIDAILTFHTIDGRTISIRRLPKAKARRLYSIAQEVEEQVRKKRG